LILRTFDLVQRKTDSQGLIPLSGAIGFHHSANQALCAGHKGVSGLSEEGQ
jgi:hypothetical protein